MIAGSQLPAPTKVFSAWSIKIFHKPLFIEDNVCQNLKKTLIFVNFFAIFPATFCLHDCKIKQQAIAIMLAIMLPSMNAFKLIQIYLNTSECGLKIIHIYAAVVQKEVLPFSRIKIIFLRFTLLENWQRRKVNKLYTIFRKS
jgi:Na+-transporting NADH:ubiquinone oxidoreductase subunit NqrB